jgi:hypothetical protein
MNVENEKIVQIKLVTGQEIIAQKLEDPSESTFTINCALEMVAVELEDPDYDESLKTSYYILRPFISYPERLEVLITLNPSTVVTMNLPSKKVIEQYTNSLTSIQEMLTDASDSSEEETEDSGGNVLSFPKLLTED